ncbi:MAG TPA: hypothetical protein VKA34_08810 [Balneolales bacterium]|nr:hypothetical protein [Balneolales bacterium]
MGQQQLLLVILVTIIVGVATVVALNVFGTSAANANRDAVRQDVLQIASSAQGWYIKPQMLAGGGNSFTGVTFNDINFPAATISSDGLTAINMNGSYKIGNITATGFTITAYPSSDPTYDGTMPVIGSDGSVTAVGVPATTATTPLIANVFKTSVVWPTPTTP